MVSGLNADAVKGIEQRKRDALASGDTEELLRLNNLVFGGFFMGPKDDSDSDGSDDNDDNASGDDEDDDDSDDDTDDDDGTSDADDNKDVVSKAEYEAAIRRMKAADQRASKAEKAEQERQRKEKSDLENAQSDLQAEKSKVTELQSELTALKLDNAFLAANTITWHNPSAAMKLAQSEGYLEDVVGEDGTVNSKTLKTALQKLAREHQYLVKKGNDDGDDGDGSSGESGPRRSRNRDDKDAKSEEMARRAPSLQRRGRIPARNR